MAFGKNQAPPFGKKPSTPTSFSKFDKKADKDVPASKPFTKSGKMSKGR
jgi:hypothetical protein